MDPKRSYLKATGTGLETPLDSFSFTLSPVRISFLADSTDLAERWHFQMLTTTGRHALSLAVANRGNAAICVSSRTVSAGDL